jgi:hypothetical protein
MKSPNTDKTLLIQKDYGPEEKFREVRHRARDEEIDRHKKMRRDKKKESQEPRYKIDELVVLLQGWQKRYYYLVQVIDYDPIRKEYFGILRNTTDPEYFEQMIGHLMVFYGQGYYSRSQVLNVPPDSIKWGVK